MPSTSTRHALALLLALTTAPAPGCVGTGFGLDENGELPGPDMAQPDSGSDDGGGARVSLRDIQANIFSPICARRCHVGATAPNGLQLDPANAWTLLVDVPSVEVPSLPRAVPGHPENSYLIVKLVPSDARRQKARMPQNGPPYLTDAQITSIRKWIQQGAQK